MSFDWESYIQLADELIRHKRTSSLHEAYLRSAISRSYYGVFCIARNLLIARKISVPRADTHKFVRTKYQKSLNKTEKKIGENLSRLWRERKDADYEDNAKIDTNRAKITYQLSLRTLHTFEEINKIKGI